MRRFLIAALAFPLSAFAAGSFTGIHPEESLPDNQEQASSDPYQPLIREVQEKLHQLGFDAGPINGEFGEKTQAALAQFQLSLVIPVSGQLDRLTLNELGVSAESASAGGSAEPTSD